MANVQEGVECLSLMGHTFESKTDFTTSNSQAKHSISQKHMIVVVVQSCSVAPIQNKERDLTFKSHYDFHSCEQSSHSLTLTSQKKRMVPLWF